MSNALFTQVAMKRPPSSTFDLTHDVKMSMKFGNLTPTLFMECIPGDNIKLGMDALVRLAPILAPIMHRVDFTIHNFYVPTRLMWANWDKFISGQTDDNGDPYVQPFIELGETTPDPIRKLADYLGITPPTTGPIVERVLAYPFIAYVMVYNEYYRDQNLIQPLNWVVTDGDNTAAMLACFGGGGLQRRAYEHDYFTSCLPFAQRGAAVDIPLGNVELAQDLTGLQPFFTDVTKTAFLTGTVQQPSAGIGNEIINTDSTDVAYLNPNGSLVVGSTTINDLRRAYRLQEWLEKNARGGVRYTEFIEVHFGVKNPDARLQRPEYITGIKAPIIISEVLNTQGPTDFYNGETGNVEQTGSPQGDMAGHGVGVHQGRVGNYYATEFGYVLGLMSVLPKTAYQQGIHRMFTKFDYLDYAFPSFANLGEQEVLKRELFAYDGGSKELFGYIPRYAEYKFMNSRVAGDFRTTLDFWHLGRIFAGIPNLSQDFIECHPDDVLRIFAVQDDTDNLWCHILNKVRINRKLPFFGTPTI